MLTKYGVENFKAFGAAPPLTLAPITLVFGANSSGKSSFIHSLLLAHEGLVAGDFDPHFTKLGGESVDLGGFQRFAHKHETTQRGTFTFETRVDKPFYSPRFVHHSRPTSWSAEQRLTPKCLRFKVEVGLVPEEPPSSKRVPRVLAYRVEADGKPFFSLTERDPTKAYETRYEEFENALFVSDINATYPVFSDLFKVLLDRYKITKPKRKAFFERVQRALEDVDVSPVTLEFDADSHPSFHEPTFAIDIVPLLSRRCSPVMSDILKDEPIGYGLDTYLEWLEGRIQKRHNPDDEEDEPETSFSSDRTFVGMQRLLEKFPGLLDLDDKSLMAELWDASDKAVRITQDVFEHMAELLRSTRRHLNSELETLKYLGPLRSYPDRMVQREYSEDPKWKAVGGDAWQTVQEDEALRARVNKWLGKDHMKTGYRLESRELFAGDDLLFAYEQSDPTATFEDVLKSIPPATTELSLIDLKTGTRVSHRDIGVGVLQVLPVLVSAYGSKQNLIMVEQPELHLHPGLQAELGDVFIESALGGSENRFLIETHSEHLILRLMRRLRETSEGRLEDDVPAIRPADVAILYVESTARGSVVRQINLDDEGQLIDAWPDGFFEEGFREGIA